MRSFLRVGRSFRYGAFRGARNLGLALLIGAGAATAEPVTIAALGDSLTQGYGLPREQGFVPQLAGWLADHGAEVTVLNAGVSGDTTAGGLSRVEWTLTPEVDAMIVALGGNDLLRGIDPAVSARNLSGILGAAKKADVPVLLVGLTAPGNYGPEFKASFDAMYPALAEQYDTLLYPNFLEPLSDDPDRQSALDHFMQADGIHPNAKGVTRVVKGIGPSVLDLVERVTPGS